MIAQATEHGLHQRFDAAARSKPRDPDDVAATRAHVGAYVEYVHYVEALHGAASAGAESHGAVPNANGHAH